MRLPCFMLRMPVRPPLDKPEHEGVDMHGEEAHVVDDAGRDRAGNVVQAQRPRDLPEVYVPTPAEVARHNLTHLPYRRLCKICAACRRKNAPHVALPAFTSKQPLLVLDGCLPPTTQTRTSPLCASPGSYPYRTVACTPCREKGGNADATSMRAA